MELTIIPDDHRVSHLRLGGRMDPHGSQEIRASLRSATIDSNRSAVVDVSDVTFITSVGIGILVDCSETMRRAGHQMIIVGATGNVDKVLRKTGIYNIITPAASIDDAITLACQ